jgi:Na+-translocating ferredoxin:NAD+ oxidoreductase RnfG subunit
MDKRMTEQNISEEEKKAIDTVLESILKQNSLSNEIEQEYEKLLDCPHELVITVTAKVLEQDETGNVVGINEICKQNYHVPVPQNKDYHEYMAGFFNRLQKCIVESDKEATEKASEINNE